MTKDVQHSGVGNPCFADKDYTELDRLLEQWHQKLADGYDLCVMLSRKGPRLNEWLENQLDSNPVQHVVTENAIPFIDMQQIKRCVIADEAIYHGTTFAKVFQIVKSSVTPDVQVDALPFVVTDGAAVRLRASLPETQLRISDKCINFFIDTIIARFQTLGKPYDMEYPLLYADMGTDFDDSKMEAIAKEIGEIFNRTLPKRYQLRHYTTSCYVREMESNFQSVSLLIDGLFTTTFAQGTRPDFAKVRLLRQGSRLCVAVMTPYVINALDLRKNTGLFEGDLLKVWNRIIEVADQYEPSTEECRYQKQKSLVVMANYLLSYASYQLIAPTLEKVLQRYGTSRLALTERDLAYLLGWQLAPTVKSMLEEGTITYTIPKVMALPVTIQDRQMPLAYDSSYLGISSSQDFGLYDQTDLRLSNLFSVMHREVEIKSRQYETSYGRLRFGESFRSICDRYTMNNDTERVRLDVHRGIDTRIDRGSVVPNYVHVGTASYDYWLRLFRSGENEDLLRDQVSRIVGYVARTYIRKAGVRSVPIADMELIFILLSLHSHLLERIFANPVRFAVSQGLIRAFWDDQQNVSNGVSLIQMAVRTGMLESTAIEEVTLNGSMYNEKGGQVLSIDTEKLIEKSVGQVIAINDDIGFDFASRELSNMLMYNQVDTDQHVQAYCEQVIKLLKNEEEPIGYDEQIEHFLDLFKIYPDQSLAELPELLKKHSCEEAARIADTCLRDPQLSKGFQILISAYYVLNIWHRIDKGTDFQNITPSNTPSFLQVFTEEEQKQLDAIAHMDKHAARGLLATLLEKKIF